MVDDKGKLYLHGLLVSYGLEYGAEFEGFGEALPIPVKQVTYCYLVPSGNPSVEHFPAIYQIMRIMEK